MKFIIFLAVISSLSSSALALGTESSGGGASLVCKNKAYLYDLFEGEVLNSYTYPKESLDPAELAFKNLDKIKDFSIKAVLVKNLNHVLSSMRYLPSGLNLQSPGDMGKQVGIITPEGCDLKGAGYFGINGLLVDSDVFNKMNNLSKAAFLLHEAVYLAARETSNEADSYSTRQAVSALFANEIPDSVKNTIYNNLLFRSDLFENAKTVGFIKNNLGKAKVRVLEASPVGKYFISVSCINGQGKQVAYYADSNSSTNEFEVDTSNCAYLDIVTAIHNVQSKTLSTEPTKKWILVDESNNTVFNGESDYLDYQEGPFKKNLIIIDRN